MPKEKKTADLRSVQGHQEVGETDRKFQELDVHARISEEEYTTKISGVAGDIDGKMHSNMAKTCWFKKTIRK